MMRTDLHLHTTASDGRWTPEQTVAGVVAEGIALFAVTDHDSVANVAPTQALLPGTSLAFLTGVEISATDNGTLLHILGYGIDVSYEPLLAQLAENTAMLEAVDDDDIQQLIARGYPISWEDYATYTYDRTRGGFKSLNFLLDRGVCSSAEDFFERIRTELNHRWPAFPPPAAIAALIRAAGGVPILAHPGVSLKKRGGVAEATLAPLKEWGLAGVECFSQYHDAETTAFCLEWCRRHDLLITGGSDYHGGFVGRQLGVPIVHTSELRLGELEARIITA